MRRLQRIGFFVLIESFLQSDVQISVMWRLPFVDVISEAMVSFIGTNDVDADFDEFYRCHRLYVHGLCRKRLRSFDDVSDLEALVWFDVVRNFVSFQEGEPRRLLFRLVSWRANDIYRQRHRDSNVKQALGVEEDRLVEWWVQSTSRAATLEVQTAIHQALMEESLRDRKLLFARYVEELTWEELAAQYDIHRNTAYKRVEATRQRMRARLEDSRTTPPRST